MRQFHDIEQNTPEWLALRMGRITASGFGDLVNPKLKKYTDYVKKLAYERVYGVTPEDFEPFTGGYLQRGHDLEPDAEIIYMRQSGEMVLPGGMYTLGDNLGASPDGRLMDNGGLEIKCLGWKAYMDYMAQPAVPVEYSYQVAFQLYVCGFDYVDFFVYHPGFTPLPAIRVTPSDTWTSIIEERIEAAEHDIAKWVRLLQEGRGK